MPAPTIQFYNITSGGSTHASDLRYLNQTGGPVGAAIGGGTRWDFGNVQAGLYTVSKALAWTATGSSISGMGFWLYDPIGTSASAGAYDFYTPVVPWKFRYKISNTYLDPTTLTPSGGDWTDLPHGSSATPINLDSLIGGGFDGTGPVVPHQTTNVWVVNAFLYIAFQVDPAAPAGIMNDFNWRLSWVYP